MREVFKTFLHPQIQKVFVRISQQQKTYFLVNRRSFLHTVLTATKYSRSGGADGSDCGSISTSAWVMEAMM